MCPTKPARTAGADWDGLSGGKGSLAERASEECKQEDLLAAQLGARTIKEKLNAFLWRDSSHVEVRELVEWCRKYLYLPRISTDQVILDALVNPQAAMTGEETFHLADSVDQVAMQARPQASSLSANGTASLSKTSGLAAVKPIVQQGQPQLHPPQPQPALRQLVDQVQPHRLLMEGRLQPLASGMWCLPRQSHLQNLSYPRVLLHQ